MAAAASAPAFALPPGRAWTPIDRYVVPGHTWFVSDWLNADTEGIPIVLGEAVGGIGQEIHALRWADSLWTVTWAGGFPTSFSWPILSPPGTYYLLWKGIQGYESPTGHQVDLVMAQFFGDHIGEQDTLGRFHSGNWVYSAAVASRRRWVAVSDYFNLRLFYSDALREWNEVEVGGSGDDGVSVAPLDDTTAVVVWAGLDEGLRWGLLSGGSWTEEPPLDARDWLANAPVLRPRPSGGYWLAWGSEADRHLDHLPIRTYRNGSWTTPESLLCARGSTGWWTHTPDLSRDGREYPAVVWSAIDGTGRETICACMPTDSGFTVADNIPYSGRATIARDRDGDVWVAWWDLFIGMFWLHTYNRATAEDVRIEGHGRHRRIAWSLSEPAPETWWAVLRAGRDDEFEPVARVRAGPRLEMSWTDSAPPGQALAYKIRRESVDLRYCWESPVVRTRERGKGLALRAGSPRPVSREAVLQLVHAAPGPVELSLYDLQGRAILRQQVTSGGSSEEIVRFDLALASAPLRNGIYFAIARDAAGESSEAVRLVILR